MTRSHMLDAIPAQLWRLVALAQHRVLMFDYDGTLAPFREERNEAYPTPGTIELLRRIAATGHTTLGIVSGRPVREVERLVGDLSAHFVGEHGWERLAPDGSLVQRPLAPPTQEALASAVRVAQDRSWSGHVERKRTAVVLHTRGLPEDEAAAWSKECEDAWGEIARDGKLNLDAIQGGLELRARGCNKGTAALSLLTHAPGGSIGVFVGDDATDEDAFDAIRDWGFGVRVGPRQGPTTAMGTLPSCASVTAFLEEWLELTARTVAHPIVPS